MNTVTVFSVVTGGIYEAETRIYGDLRLVTVNQQEAEHYARTIFRSDKTGDIPDIVAEDRMPTDHTTKLARKLRYAPSKSYLTKLAEEAAKIRASRSAVTDIVT